MTAIHTPGPWEVAPNPPDFRPGTERLFSVVRRSLIQNSVVVETLAENVELADADRIVLACNHHDSLRRSLGALLEHFSEHTCAGEAGHSGKTYWRGECANHPESAFNRARAALADVSK